MRKPQLDSGQIEWHHNAERKVNVGGKEATTNSSSGGGGALPEAVGIFEQRSAVIVL